MSSQFTQVQVANVGEFEYYNNERGIACTANFPLMLIRLARDRGCEFEDLADGFGEGMGTMGGDWSGIRDSSPAAVNQMLERALNYIDACLTVGAGY